jgi:hypothetical protein
MQDFAPFTSELLGSAPGGTARKSIALKPLIAMLVITLTCHSWITGLNIFFNLKHCVVWLTKSVSIQLLNFHQIFAFF